MEDYYFERMDGLSRITDNLKLSEAVKSLTKDFLKEGFDEEDIIKYLNIVVKESFNDEIISNRK